MTFQTKVIAEWKMLLKVSAIFYDVCQINSPTFDYKIIGPPENSDNQDITMIKNVIIPDYPFNQNELDSMQFNYLCINNNMTMQSTSNMKKFIEMLITRNDNCK